MWDSLTRNTPMVRIFIRPKIVLFLSLIALFFLLINWSKEPELLKAHVTLKEVKRVVLFPKGETVKGLRYIIIRDFSDLLNDRMPPACLRIQEHDDTFDDDFDIPINLKLDEGVRVKAKLPATQQELAACGPKTYSSPNSGNSTFAFHPVKPNIPYRLWSPVYGGSFLLQRGPNNVVNCKGELGGYRNFNETVVTSKSTGKHYAFIFKENAGPGAKQYALTVETETRIVAKEIQNPSPTPKDFTRNMKFIPYYFWSFTLLKSVNYSNLYLGCDSTGKARLVPMKSTNYPDARALFIFNKEVLDNFSVTSKSIYPHK